MIHPETFEYLPTVETRTAFEAATGLPYAMPIATTLGEDKLICCPICDAEIRVHWITRDGLGWAQKTFAHKCPICRTHFDHEVHVQEVILRHRADFALRHLACANSVTK